MLRLAPAAGAAAPERAPRKNPAVSDGASSGERREITTRRKIDHAMIRSSMVTHQPTPLLKSITSHQSIRVSTYPTVPHWVQRKCALMSRQSQSGSFLRGSLPQCPQILPLGGPTQYTRTLLKPASRLIGLPNTEAMVLVCDAKASPID